MLNPNHPAINALIKRFKTSIGEPQNFPLSNTQRTQFELSLLNSAALKAIFKMVEENEKEHKKMKAKVLRKKLYRMAMLQEELDFLYEEVEEEFDDCIDFKPYEVLHNCVVKNGFLYGADGEVISKNSRRGTIPFFVNESAGNCEDDYYADLFYLVDDKGTVVVVYYHA